jgi:hypothetical protein
MEEEKRVSAGQKQNGAKSDNGNGQQVPSLGTEQKFFLIECIEQRPCLWDQLCEEFRNNTVRHSAFNDVALLMTQKCGEEFTRKLVPIEKQMNFQF